MELTKILNHLNTVQVIGEVQRQDITGIYYDSRKVKSNSIFVAIKGYKTDGHKFILDALNSGAIAVVVEDKNSAPDEIFIHQNRAKIVVKNSRIALAQLSGFFYGEPSEKLKLIGITGTNGKTTTSYFIKNILEANNAKVGLIGTIANYIGDKKVYTEMTTPESVEINKLLLDMYEEECSHAVMEVSSHSLALNRTYGINFSAGVFTNITSDHLDFHGNFENYLKAKKVLFDALPQSAFGVYNSDDKNSLTLIKNSQAKTFSYGTASNADFFFYDIKYDLSGTSFSLTYNGTDYSVSTSLIGEFNAYNACAAFATTVLLGVKEEVAIEGIKTMRHVPGRFEVFGQDKKVIVDYSHTADSLEKTLLALRKIINNRNPVYTVFGCGGDRDKTKRPIMGKIASELSDKIIITTDNPRTEDPLNIIKDIENGVAKKNFKTISDREEAIKFAIENSEGNAVILIAGKGHENYQEINGVRRHFSDREVAEKYLAK